VKVITDKLGTLLATAGGAGYSPIAPGTCGTLIAVPIAYACAGLSLPLFAAITVAVVLVGIWASNVADGIWQTHDSGRIVIDEVAGYLITVLVVPRDSLPHLLTAFILFRAADIIKPPPIRAIDRHVQGGLGVMLDDVAAGILAAAVLYAIDSTGWL
jgi:phosphatidylglycerophosphatase A